MLDLIVWFVLGWFALFVAFWGGLFALAAISALFDGTIRYVKSIEP